jgi:tetratricopeptide (TPR) repeat protein
MEILKKILIIGTLIFLFNTNTYSQASFLTQQTAFNESYMLESQGNYKMAADKLKDVYQEDSYELNLRLGWLNYMAGNFIESIAFYNKSVQLMPYADEPKFGFIFPLSAVGKWDEVIEIYKEILSNSPHNTKALYYLGTIYYNRGEFDKAKLNFKQMVDLYPFDYDGLLMYAWCNFKLGNKKAAKILFQKVLLNKPNDASSIEGLSLIN